MGEQLRTHLQLLATARGLPGIMALGDLPGTLGFDTAGRPTFKLAEG